MTRQNVTRQNVTRQIVTRQNVAEPREYLDGGTVLSLVHLYIRVYLDIGKRNCLVSSVSVYQGLPG